MTLKKEEFVQYQGRSVPKKHFRTFVFSKDGQRLVNSYEEYRIHIASKEWFDTKADVPLTKKRVKKNDADSKGVCE